MINAEKFLTDFTKDLIAHPMERQKLIAGWAKHLESVIDNKPKEVHMDWREIFKKYINMVGEAEGVYFIDESQFTPEENAEIEKVIDERTMLKTSNIKSALTSNIKEQVHDK